MDQEPPERIRRVDTFAVAPAGTRAPTGPTRSPREVACIATRLTLPPILALLANAAATAALAAGPINLSQTPGCSANPDIASAGDRTMVAWAEDDAIWFALRTGGSWSTPAPVANAVGVQPALAGTADGAFELVWSQYRDTNQSEDILHSRYSAGGWSAPTVVADTPDVSLAPDIAVADDGTRFVVWAEGEPGATTLFGAFASTASAWSGNVLPGGSGTAPAVAYSAGAWHLTWVANYDPDGAGEVRYRRRGPGGWSAAQVVNVGEPTASEPSIAVGAAGDVAIIWLAGGTTVSFARWSDGVWLTSVGVDGGETATGRPAVTLTDSGAAAAWPRYVDVRLAREAGGVWLHADTAMQFPARTRGVRLTTMASGLGLVAEGRGVRGASDIYFIDPDARPPTDTPTPTTAPPTGTVVRPGTASPTPLRVTATPTRAAVYLPFSLVRSRPGTQGLPAVGDPVAAVLSAHYP